jgi:hypothetical protein
MIFSIVVILPYQINHWTTLLSFRYDPSFEIMSNAQVQLWKLIVFTVIFTELINIIVWSLIKYHKKYLKNFDVLSFSCLTIINLFFAVAIFTSGLYLQLPILIFLCFSSLFFHLLIHFLPYFVNRKTVYFFNSIKEVAEDSKEQLDKVIKASLK